MSESQEQATVVQYFKLKWPNEVVYASANGAHLAGSQEQRKRKMVRMKREGLLPGAPDLCFAVARGGYHALYIEMKIPGSTYSSVSKEQRKVIQSLRDSGNKAEWCPGASAAIKIIDEYMALPSYTSFGVDMASGKDHTATWMPNNSKRKSQPKVIKLLNGGYKKNPAIFRPCRKQGKTAGGYQPTKNDNKETPEKKQ